MNTLKALLPSVVIYQKTQYLNRQVKNYVDVQMDELGKLSRQTRKTMEEERDKLTKERNSLPWE